MRGRGRSAGAHARQLRRPARRLPARCRRSALPGEAGRVHGSRGARELLARPVAARGGAELAVHPRSAGRGDVQAARPVPNRNHPMSRGRADRRTERPGARPAPPPVPRTVPPGARRGRLLLDEIARAARRHPGRVRAALIGLYLVLAALSFEPQPHTGGDNAGYVTLARSLLERHSYQDLYDPAEPPHTKYPPVFPLVLAAGLMLGLKPWVGLKLIGLVMGAGAIAGTFLWLRRRGRPGLALGVALLLAVSPDVLRQVHWVLSDVPFWCFTAGALWAFERLRPDDWRRFALALAFTVLAYFTRSAGLPLVIAAAAWLAWRRHGRQLAALALVIGPLAFLWWWRAHAAGGVQYAGEFWMVDPYRPDLGRMDVAGLIGRLGNNLAKYATIHLPILLRGTTTLPAIAASLAVLGLGGYGWARRCYRRARVAELFLPLYLGLILLWPAVWSGERFLMPVLGLLLAYAGDGVVRIFGSALHGRAGTGTARRTLRMPAPRGAVAGAVAAAALLVLAMPGLAANFSNSRACLSSPRGQRYPCVGPEWNEYFELAGWARAALPKDAVVLSRNPRHFYVASGLQGRNYPMASTTQALLASADSAGARWVVFDALGGLAQRYLAPALLQRPQAFCIAQAAPSGATILFGILPDAARIPDAPRSGGAEGPQSPTRAQPLGEVPAVARAAGAP
ncbi:MAG: hypothetical protein FIB01_11795 [Gemmatimonadetes bacterium]|nr:hypothetical protein [Gemmatimonadota bacterium]